MTDLTALIARVEALSGPDREVERDAWEALTGECVHRATEFVYLDDDERELQCVACKADTYGKDPWRGITKSLDAVVALAERVKPGWRWAATSADGPNRWPAQGELWIGDHEYIGRHATPALALLLALLRAVQAQTQETT